MGMVRIEAVDTPSIPIFGLTWENIVFPFPLILYYFRMGCSQGYYLSGDELHVNA
jgi:hypothetical protein